MTGATTRGFIAAVLLAAHAHAAPVAVDERAIELPTPAGYCPIDRDRSPDAQAWEAMRALQEPQNRLLAWFVACDELERWRANPRGFERHAIVLAPVVAPTEPPVPSRRDYVAAVTRGFEESQGAIRDNNPELSRLRERTPGLAPGPLTLRLLERNDDCVLATMVQQVEGPSGPRRVVSVIAFTAVNQTRLSANFYGPDDGPEALRPVRDAAVGYLSQLIAANPEPRSRGIWLAVAGAVVVLAGLGAVLLWHKRRRQST